MTDEGNGTAIGMLRWLSHSAWKSGETSNLVHPTPWSRGSRVCFMVRALLLGSVLLTACSAPRSLPDGVDPAKRDWYGEFYNLKEYARCVRETKDARNTQCEYLRLTRVAEPEYWPYPNVPRPKLPDAPNPPVYREGMTSKEYFDALCKAEAGEFIHRTVEGVEGVYQIRPRKEASWDALMDRYVMEDPYGYTRWEATEPEAIFSRGEFARYTFFEAPVRGDSRAGGGISSVVNAPGDAVVLRSSKFDGRNKATMTKDYDTRLKSRYGFLWRGIKRPFDRELGIAGGELVVVDLTTGEILGIRRGFARSGFVRNSRSGIQWETAEVCPRLRRTPDGWDKSGDFSYWFVSKVLRPRN